MLFVSRLGSFRLFTSLRTVSHNSRGALKQALGYARSRNACKTVRDITCKETQTETTKKLSSYVRFCSCPVEIEHALPRKFHSLFLLRTALLHEFLVVPSSPISFSLFFNRRLCFAGRLGFNMRCSHGTNFIRRPKFTLSDLNNIVLFCFLSEQKRRPENKPAKSGELSFSFFH